MNRTSGNHRPTRNHRLSRSAAALVILPLLLAGCGGEDDGDATDNAVGAEENEANAPDGHDDHEGNTDGGDPGNEDSPGNDGNDTDDAVTEAAVITIVDFEYETTGTIEPGAEVTLTNEDSVGHTVTSDEDGVFDVEVGPGETVTFTAPEEPGEYPYFCVPHPEMVSTLVVEDSAGR